MTPEEIQQLRKELTCTARELATTLGVDPKEVSAWEAGELFPTKRYVQAMEGLRARGPSAIVRAPKGKAPKRVGLDRLSDPALWKLFRKLLDHPQLFDDVQALAAKYPDPPEAKPSESKGTG
ncbi:MAG TPA: helix-turn-helix domain-containing protein [Polyangiaceae bacterium]|nr:helix-turn-helix domain-containing protein [Polyangiaceae bacterium]